MNAADALTNLIVRITSFYVLAFLASFIIEQEKKTSTLLEAKASEFNQLDRLFRSIVESVYSGVMTIDLNNVIKTFNAAAEEITGFQGKSTGALIFRMCFLNFLQFLIRKPSTNKQSSNRNCHYG